MNNLTRRFVRDFVTCAGVFGFSLATLGVARAQTLTAAPDRPSGVYSVGDTVHWRITWPGPGQAPAPARYTVKSGGLTEIAHGNLTFNGNSTTLASKFAAPNTLLLEVDWPAADGGKPGQVFAGAVADPGRIRAAAPPPADFDSFWKDQIRQLKAVPAHPRLTPGDSEKPDVSYWKVTLDNIGGTHVQGQIARPTTGKKFPALLQLQYAGVYGLQKGWVTNFAKSGWLALNIEAHDIPIDETPAFYSEQEAGPLHNYWNGGDDDRSQSYYRRMYLSCIQALEYLSHRPDWDGKTLVVTGQSQGGQQALMLAGLHPQNITAVMALVPAACDMLAPTVGRAPGFPSWYFNTQGKDPTKVREASRYYDPVNFARHIRCPILIALGLHDEKLAPPSSILAAANGISAPKEVIIMPNSGHTPVGNSQQPYYSRMYGAWLPALVQGRPAPIATGK